MTTSANNAEFEDFPLSPCGSVSAVEFYESFLKSEELANSLPQKELRRVSDLAFCNFLQEIHSARSASPALFRKRGDANQALTMLWLSRVREIAQLFVTLNEVPNFSGLTSEDLSKLSKLSMDIANLPKLAGILFELGIVLIYERSIPGMKLDGAVFNLGTDRPIIALSLRYSRLDNFWFTLMHELAHVSLHYDKLCVPILDDLEEMPINIIEKQADRLSSNSLVSRSDWRSCNARYDLSAESINDFAAQVQVHPSIVAGRLQKELKRYDIFSKIVNAVDVRKVLLSHE